MADVSLTGFRFAGLRPQAIRRRFLAPASVLVALTFAVAIARIVSRAPPTVVRPTAPPPKGGTASQESSKTTPSPATTSDAPFDVMADNLEHGPQERVGIFSGEVDAVQGLTRLETPRLTVHYAPSQRPARPRTGDSNRKITHMEAEGPVRYTTPTVRALADRGDYDGVADIITLTGHVVLLQGRAVATGDKLVIERKAGHYVLSSEPGLGGSGRVRTILYPAQSLPSPAATDPSEQATTPPSESNGQP